MVISAIQQPQRQTIKASATSLAAGREDTAFVRITALTGVLVKPLPQWCIVKVGGGQRGGGPRVCVFFHGRRGTGGCEMGGRWREVLPLSKALASNHH